MKLEMKQRPDPAITRHKQFNKRRKELEAIGYACIELDESIRYAKYKKGRRVILIGEKL